MRFMLCLLAVGISASTALHPQPTNGVPIVNADGPTVVAFFPNASSIGSDGDETISDFKYYAMRVKKPLAQLGIRFIEEYGRSFRMSSGSERALFTRNSGTSGYYFFAKGKRPRIVYGVRTDSDLLAMAREYFTDEKK